MTEIAWVNGDFMPLAEAKVSIDDRGFLFGDGAYEVLCGYDGRLWAAERHWRRLARSLRDLGIRGVDIRALAGRVAEAVERAGTPTPLVYIQVTRGVAPRSHHWDPAITPSILITVREASFPPDEWRDHGVSCITTEDLRWGRCDIKSLNLLANVMAKQEARQTGAFEALLVRPDGTVTEGSSTSLCIVRDGVVWCHPEGRRILPGITRRMTLELAEEHGYQIRCEPFDTPAIKTADEVYITGTSIDVVGVTRVDDEEIADGRIGPVTARLRDLFHGAIRDGRDAPRD